VKVEDILITPHFEVLIDGNPLDNSEREGLARRDGFENFSDMAAFWKGRVPFSGDVIHWRTPDVG
jgi:hypothetical protein